MNAKPPTPSVWWALFSFRGRISRQSYFLGAALMLVVHFYIMLNVAQADQNNSNFMAAWSFVLVGYWLLSLVAMLALTAKRLHDLNLSGRWLILLFLPMISMIFVVMMMVMPGSQQTNRHGPPPFPKN